MSMQLQLVAQPAMINIGVSPAQIKFWLHEAIVLTEQDGVFDGELLELDASVILSNDKLLLESKLTLEQVLENLLNINTAVC